MRFATTIIITVILAIILQGCSVTNDKSPEITTIANSEEHSRDLFSEISEKINQKNAEISDDLLMIPSLLTQVQDDNVLELYPNGNSIRYNYYNKKIESSKTSLVYDGIVVEISPLEDFTIEEIISAFSDTFTCFEIEGDEVCAVFLKKETNQTVVNLLFFEPSKKCKCFVATKIEGLFDLSKKNVKRVYKDFILTAM